MPVDFVGLLSLLAAAQARFVVVGGLAVVLHGFDRLTSDVDLVIDLSSDNAGKTIAALVKAGYRSLAPVDPMSFANADQRHIWQTQRGMQVFSLWDSTNTRPSVDLFVDPPIPFETLYAASIPVKLGSTEVRLASLEHLIAMKRIAGRAIDAGDIAIIESRLAKDRE